MRAARFRARDWQDPSRCRNLRIRPRGAVSHDSYRRFTGPPGADAAPGSAYGVPSP
ncbi:hypothetical protein FRAHR75_150091 [Frankia sp. Hr75.2]|nr:hypothetical protein FRAHR75_150091 [Frankia sp. Hr75.2]SQD96628.1 hypothetical protein FMEAI12_3670025 [Parafrankia sp. Ea1.12]